MKTFKKLFTKTIAGMAIVLLVVTGSQESAFAQGANAPDILIPSGGSVSFPIGFGTFVTGVRSTNGNATVIEDNINGSGRITLTAAVTPGYTGNQGYGGVFIDYNTGPASKSTTIFRSFKVLKP